MSAEGQDRGRVPVNMATDPPWEHLHKGYTVEVRAANFDEELEQSAPISVRQRG